MKSAFFAADRSVIPSHCAAMSSTDGGLSKLMPSFWNSATVKGPRTSVSTVCQLPDPSSAPVGSGDGSACRQLWLASGEGAVDGAAVGVAATMLLRPRKTPRLGDVARDTARRAGKRTEQWLDALPNGEEIKEKLSDYVETARDGIDRIVEGELRSLRKRIRRERRRLHI